MTGHIGALSTADLSSRYGYLRLGKSGAHMPAMCKYDDREYVGFQLAFFPHRSLSRFSPVLEHDFM